MTFTENKNKTLVLILTAGLILRLLLLLYFWDKPLTIVDEKHYQAIAENILYYGEFSLETGHPTSIRPPLYPAFLSFIYFLTGGIHYNAVRIIQIVIGLATVFLVFILGRKIFNEKVGLLSAFIFAVYPSFLFFTHLLLTEVLFTFLFLCFVWCFILFTDNKENKYIWLTGLFLGLSALTRSILYPFIGIAVIFMLITCKGTVIQRSKWMVLLIIGYALVIGPWAVRNTILQKDLVVVGTMGGLNLHMGNYEHTPLNRAWAAIDLQGEKSWYHGHEETLIGMTEAQKQKWAVKRAKEFMKNNKLLTLKRDLIKAANFWGLERVLIAGMVKGHYPEFSSKRIVIPVAFTVFSFYALVIMASIFGVFFTFQYDKRIMLLFLILTFYFTGIHALVFGHPRYHLPLISYLVIFASWSFMNIQLIWSERKSWIFKMSLVISLLFIFAWSRELVFVDAPRFIGNAGF